MRDIPGPQASNRIAGTYAEQLRRALEPREAASPRATVAHPPLVRAPWPQPDPLDDIERAFPDALSAVLGRIKSAAPAEVRV